MVFQILALGPKLSHSHDPDNPVAAAVDYPAAAVVVDDAGVAMLCKVPGTDDISLDSVPCPVPAEVAVAWPTALDCAEAPAGVVVCWGGSNGVSRLAAAEEPA